MPGLRTKTRIKRIDELAQALRWILTERPIDKHTAVAAKVLTDEIQEHTNVILNRYPHKPVGAKPHVERSDS